MKGEMRNEKNKVGKLGIRNEQGAKGRVAVVGKE